MLSRLIGLKSRAALCGVLCLVGANAWALDDEALAPTRQAKNYIGAFAQYADYDRDQVVRATGEKGGESQRETWLAGLRGYYVVNDNFDVKGSIYRKESSYQTDWLGSRVADRSDDDPMSVSTTLRYKFLSNEKGGLVGQLYGWYGSSESHGYEMDVKPFINLSANLAATLRAGIGEYKAGDGHQQKEYVTASLIWKPTVNMMLNPVVGATHYDSHGVWSSEDVYSMGVNARYDIDSRWSVRPSLHYYRYGDKHNNQYPNELGNGDEVVLSIQLSRYIN